MEYDYMNKVWLIESYLVYTRTGTKSETPGLPTLLANPGYPLGSNSVSESDTSSFVPGQFKITPYSISRTYYRGSGQGGAAIDKSAATYYSHKEWYGQLTLSAAKSSLPDPASAEDYSHEARLAAQRALAKVGQSALQLPVEFGELDETLRMLKSPLKNLRNFFLRDGKRNLKLLNSLIKEGKGGKVAIDALSTASSTWLEFRYGIRPLISSIQAVIKEVNATANRCNRSSILTKVAHWSKEDHFEDSNESFWQTIPIQIDVSQTINYNCRGVAYYQNKWDSSKIDRWGLTPRFLPEAAWELTRLSFVVDWIFQVGPWLGSMRYQPNLVILGDTASTKVDFVGSLSTSLRGNAPVADTTFTFESEPVNVHYEDYSRSINTSPSHPLFRYAGGISIPRTIDAVALILQPVLKGLRR